MLSSHARALDIAREKLIVAAKVRLFNICLSHMCIAFVLHVVGIVDFVMDVYFYLL